MKRVLARAFRTGLALNAWLTRSRWSAVEGRVLTPFFVRLTRWIRGAAPAEHASSDARALGAEWERLLGNRKYAHVTAIDEATQTAYGEITGLCPLRGTGDVAACHRLMAYDRGLMAPLGARFVVLASQAEVGRTSCRVAIRPNIRDDADLMPAHRLVRPHG